MHISVDYRHLQEQCKNVLTSKFHETGGDGFKEPEIDDVIELRNIGNQRDDHERHGSTF